MRILVLVLSCAREPWRTIELAGQRATWAGADIPAVPVRYYYGLHRGPVFWGSRILKYLLANDSFDYLLRTNTTSYVERDRLRSSVSGLPRSGFYGGIVEEMDGVPYVSGTGILLSRDAAKTAATDPLWEFDLVDDVALGRSMRRAGI